jgi:hypothetical protein
MANDLLHLADSLNKLDKAIPEAASKVAKAIALTIVADLAYKTPVDTSNAISNWQTTLGVPASVEIPPHYMGSRGSTFAASAGETIAHAKVTLGIKKPGQSIYIANNADYIKDLNEGSSRQQPAGFVERAELLGRRIGAEKAKTWLKLK